MHMQLETVAICWNFKLTGSDADLVLTMTRDSHQQKSKWREEQRVGGVGS